MARSCNPTIKGVNRGEANPASKLTEANVKTIRRLRGVLTWTQLANAFGVKHSCIRAVLRGENWSWLK
jgi:hypothetical protein